MKQRVLLKGTDALDLLHRISSLDFKRMPLNQKRAGLILNPKGLIVSFFHVTRASADSVELSFEDKTLEVIEQYTFSESFEINPLHPAPDHADSENLARILALTPAYAKEFTSDGTINPLEINLKTAIDDQKGCYPGQEIIEKIISLGSPAKRLCLVKTQEANTQKFSTPKSWMVDQHEIGILTSYAIDPNGYGFGLAILKRNFAVAGKEIDFLGTPFTVEKISS